MEVSSSRGGRDFDTPRTDAAVIQSETDDRLAGETVSADFARGLERELVRWTSFGRSLYHDDVQREIAAAKSGSERNCGWIAVTDRPMPNDLGGSHLVANARGQVAPCIRGVIANNVGTAYDWNYGEPVTHWMPMPSPPHNRNSCAKDTP